MKQPYGVDQQPSLGASVMEVRYDQVAQSAPVAVETPVSAPPPPDLRETLLMIYGAITVTDQHVLELHAALERRTWRYRWYRFTGWVRSFFTKE
jgi:hypothetical protein